MLKYVKFYLYISVVLSINILYNIVFRLNIGIDNESNNNIKIKLNNL